MRVDIDTALAVGRRKLVRTGVVQQQERVEVVPASIRKQAADGKTVADPVLRNVLDDAINLLHGNLPIC
jgi:hydroxymethylpyrimidine/phosphomethylpyrimidine kinase